MNVRKVVIVEVGIIGKERRQHLFDGKAPLHCPVVHKPVAEYVQKVVNVITDAQKPLREVGKVLCKFLDARALKCLVVGKHARPRRDIRDQTLCERAARVRGFVCEKFFVEKFPIRMLQIVQRILKGNLLIGSDAVIERNTRLKGFEVEKVQRIGERIQERPDAELIDARGELQLFKLHLTALRGVEFDAALYNVIKRDDPLIVVLIRLFCCDAIEIEYAGRRQIALAVLAVDTVIRLAAVHSEILFRLLLLRKICLCKCRLCRDVRVKGRNRRSDIVDAEQLVNLHVALPHILIVDIDDIDTDDLQAARLQHPALIGGVPEIDVLELRTRFYFIDFISVRGLMQNVHRAVAAILGECRLADIFRSLRKKFFGIPEHSGNIQPPFRRIGGRFDIRS